MLLSVAQAIRDARTTVRLTQRELAERMGLKGRAVYRWENGRSAPRGRHRRPLVSAIHALDPSAASKLQAVFESHTRKAQGAVIPAPVAPAPAKPAPELAFELAFFLMAEELDLAPRRLRASLAKLLAQLAEAGFSLEAARRHLEARVAAGGMLPGSLLGDAIAADDLGTA